MPNYYTQTASNQNNQQGAQQGSSAIYQVGGVIGGAYIANKIFQNNSKAQHYLQSPLSVLDLNTKESSFGTLNEWKDLRPNKRLSASDRILEGIRKAEEYSPFRILRTFDISHTLTPFVLGKNVEYKFTSESVRAQESYFKQLLASQGNFSLTTDHIDNGFLLRDGSLFELDSKGNVGKKAVDTARLVFTHFDLPKDADDHRTSFSNKIFDKYRDIIGDDAKTSMDRLKYAELPQISVIGAKSEKGLAGMVSRAYGRAVFEKAVRIWDKPFEHMVDWFPALEDSPSFNRVKGFLQLNLGTGGDYTKSVPKSLGIMGKNLAKAAGVYAGYQGLDWAVRQVSSEESPYSLGIIEGMATTYANARLSYAKTVSDRFQGYKEKQEYLAPGSTNMMTLAGFPLSLAMTAGIASYGKRIYDINKHGVEQAEINSNLKGKVIPFLDTGFFNREFGRGKRWAVRGGAVGTLLALPFLPGALVGDSSEELYAEYSGEKEVAVRSNRWWFSGGNKYEGEKIKYFQKGWYARLMSGAKTKSLYNDQETKDSLNPFLHPFDYLNDPYKFEKMHQEDRPYPIWGMDISAGSFFGKFYERTIGQLIKPDVINPALNQYTATGNSQEGDITVSSPIAITTRQNIDNLESSGEIDLRQQISETDASLIADGMMTPPESPNFNPNKEALAWSYGAAKDFTGLRGWTIDMMGNMLGTDFEKPEMQLSRSGEATNIGRDIRDANIGGAFGLTEPQRRMIPTSSGSLSNRVNPLRNNMPSWLPDTDDGFYVDFSTGDPYTKIENGAYRLPGKGYEALFPELSGYSPEEYPEIFKLKILSDVALGSKNYYGIRKTIDAREQSGDLTEYESKLLSQIRDQELQRSEKKQFSEYKTEADLEGVGTLGRITNKYWETVTHNSELPSDYLTFFRPAAKLIHQRTAIEDYEKTQLHGSDIALWNKPVEHFIEPAVDSSIALVDDSYIPEDVQERRNIDEFFDKLEYIKYRKLYKRALLSGDNKAANDYKAKYDQTLQGALASNLDRDVEVLRAYMALPENEKPYFGSFSAAQSQEERDRILEIVPSKLRGLYQTLWSREDTISAATASGANVEEAVANQINNENSSLADSYPDLYRQYQNSGASQNTTFKEYIADVEAESYINEKTGMPDEQFVGWDPRINLDEVKLRTLSVGKEDVREYGFWQTDEDHLNRMVAIIQEQQVTNDLEKIKKNIKDRKQQEDLIAKALYKQGFDVKSIRVSSGESNITLNVEGSNE